MGAGDHATKLFVLGVVVFLGFVLDTLHFVVKLRVLMS